MVQTHKEKKGGTDEEIKAVNEASSAGLDTTKEDMYIDDVQFEDIQEGENPAMTIKKLREKLRTCESEKKEYLDGWQRMRADYANARKEEETRRGEIIKFASEGLVEDVLPVLDSFRMAFSNKEAWEKVDKNWRTGVEYIHAQLLSVLESRGLTEIGTIGEKIDPRIHVVTEVIPVNDTSKEDTVSEVIQKGYRLHSKVVRPAKVKSFGNTIE
ncbi:MAG: nucleotide exchange factor GrpE [Patescibacteria group bacterium]